MTTSTQSTAEGAASSTGLSSAQASELLRRVGANAVPEERRHPLRLLLGKLWGPVPWMLEVVVALQLALGKPGEAAIIAALLLVNALLGFVQENRANQALALLRQRLEVSARVCRDGVWRSLAARDLVPGDWIRLRLGDMAPADLRLLDGRVLVDQSSLTGESLPLDAAAGAQLYAGALIRRGEASGLVTATGARTYFGKTAALVRSAKAQSHLEATIFSIVRYLVALDALLIAVLLVYATLTGMALAQVLPFTLVLLVASVPAALPATFTLANALGARDLAARGVLVTHLAAIEEAAAMDVLATDKTGTVTENSLSLVALQAQPPHTEDELLRCAALACDDAAQDPLDLAVLAALQQRGLALEPVTRDALLPFDPQTRRVELRYRRGGEQRRVLKGAAATIAALCADAGGALDAADRFERQGLRVLGVAEGGADALHWLGLLAFEDPPRADAAPLMAQLHALGLRVVMVTGDGEATARSVATQIGLGERACPAQQLREQRGDPVAGCDVFARALPEDKYHLVHQLQRAGHVVGMTGDGVNDAPALKQAEVGIAVANATDVAKASASLVLTRVGLADVVSAVLASRAIHQRMLTYTLNKIVKTIEIAVFLSLGVMLSGVLVVTPLLIVLLLFANDFVSMSIATDRVWTSGAPQRWHIGTLMAAGVPLAACLLLLSFGVFFGARAALDLSLAQLQTLMFLLLVFSGQGTVYLVRERRAFWRSWPSRWMLLASGLDIVVVVVMAHQGVWMAALPLWLIAGLLALLLLYLLLMDALKIRIFRALGLN